MLVLSIGKVRYLGMDRTEWGKIQKLRLHIAILLSLRMQKKVEIMNRELNQKEVRIIDFSSRVL